MIRIVSIRQFLRILLRRFLRSPTRPGFVGSDFRNTKHIRCIELTPREDFYVRSAFEIEG